MDPVSRNKEGVRWEDVEGDVQLYLSLSRAIKSSGYSSSISPYYSEIVSVAVWGNCM